MSQSSRRSLTAYFVSAGFHSQDYGRDAPILRPERCLIYHGPVFLMDHQGRVEYQIPITECFNRFDQLNPVEERHTLWSELRNLLFKAYTEGKQIDMNDEGAVHSFVSSLVNSVFEANEEPEQLLLTSVRKRPVMLRKLYLLMLRSEVIPDELEIMLKQSVRRQALVAA